MASSRTRTRPSSRASNPNDPAFAWTMTRWLVALILLPIGFAGAHWWLSLVALAIVALTLRPTRWILAVLGMTVIRAYVVHRTRPYRTELGPAGSVIDPNAPWRQWLDARCHTCGA